MSQQKWLPSILGVVNRHTRTPLMATAVVTLLVLVFALWLPLVTLAKLTSLIVLTVFTLINLALWRVKLRSPVPENHLSVPLLIPITGFFFSLAFVLYQIPQFFITQG